MDTTLKNMDRLSALLDAMAGWICREPKNRLIYAALSRGRSRNTPYPLIGILFMAEGEYEWWEQGGVRFKMPHNHIRAGFSHRGACSSEPGPGAGFWACAFDASGVAAFDPFANGPLMDSVPVQNPARLLRAYQDVAMHFLRLQELGELRLKAALLNWIAALLDETRGRALGAGSARPLPVERALEFMHRQIGNSEITLEDVALASGLSMQHFGRVFAAAMHQSPIAYLRHIRIEHAKNLLREPKLRISEVAQDSGFSDPLHFSRVFRALAGESPRAFRGP